jgi:phosphotransferase system HPr-like phosphotransfer protein
VQVTSANGTANGKSVLELAMLAAPKGTRLAIVVEGAGCEAALAGLVALVTSGFRG